MLLPLFIKNHYVLHGLPRTSTPTGLIVALIFACRGGVSPPDFLGLSWAPTPTDLCDILYFDCRGDHNVFEENLRLAKWSSVIYKGIILFKKDRRGRRSLQICAIFVILIVGATIGRPRTCNARPYGFNGCPKIRL